jgi:hypothetical protein
MRFALVVVSLFACVALVHADKPAQPLPPAEAARKVGEQVTVEMLVRASKNALARRPEIYLDSEEDFHDPKNLAVVIPQAGAARFKEAGIEDPAAHFKGKTLRVTGTVTRKDERPRIEVDDPGQIRVVEKKD